MWLGTGGIDLGALTGFFYCFDLRERILDLFEASGGARMHPNYIRVGGLGAAIFRTGFSPSSTRVIEMYEPRMRDVRRLLQKNPILQDRMIDVGIISADEAVAWSAHRPVPARDRHRVRRAPRVSVQRLRAYEFDVITRTEGDAYARFLVRLDEMDEAMRIIRQVRKQLDDARSGGRSPTPSSRRRPKRRSRSRWRR